MRHQSAKSHACQTYRCRRIVPAAAEVDAGIGKRIHYVFHNGVNRDNAGKQEVEMLPSAGTAPPAEHDDRQEHDVLGHGEELVSGTVGLRLRREVLPRNDQEHVQVYTRQEQ